MRTSRHAAILIGAAVTGLLLVGCAGTSGGSRADRPAPEQPAAAKGKTKVRTRGVPGLKRITYEVTYTDGVETGREKVREEVVKKPVTKVVVVGTKQPRCDPNYAGACVPTASDVDCAGGSGNGPAYVEGPVKVVGTDIYDLDHDNDGIGCE